MSSNNNINIVDQNVVDYRNESETEGNQSDKEINDVGESVQKIIGEN